MRKYEYRAYQRLFEKGLDTKSRHYNPTTKKYTPERQMQHDKIITDLLNNPNAKPKPGMKPTVIFLGGPSGSGKTSVISNLINKQDYVYLNSDDIKEALPEYIGLNAGLLHEESTDIYDHASDLTRDARLNVVLDATLKNTQKAKQQMQKFREAGYNVRLIGTNLPYQDAIRRATDRAIHKGRVVSPEMIAINTPKINTSIRDLAASADEYQIYNTNTPKDQPPILQAQGQNYSN